MNEQKRRPLIPGDLHALRFNNFDALRLFFALAVVWSHCFALWFGSEAGEPLSLILGGTYNSGSVAVLAFFSISGFLISMSFANSRSNLSFLKRRVQRIFPAYLVAMTLTSLVVVPAFSSRAFFQVDRNELFGLVSNLWLRNYILPSDAFGGGTPNGALWSIPYEFWCYIGVLALGATGLLKRFWVFPSLALLVMSARIGFDITDRRPAGGLFGTIFGFPYGWLMVLPPFLLGGAAFVLRKYVPRSGWLLLSGILVTILVPHLPIGNLARDILTRLALPPTLTYAVFYLAFSPRVRLHDAARYGDFSYGAYLWGFPVQRMLVVLCKPSLSFALFVPLCLIGALGFGVMSWQFVERHFVQRARKGAAAPGERAPLIVPPPAGSVV